MAIIPGPVGRTFQTVTGQIATAILMQQFNGLYRHASRPGGIRQISLEKFAGNFRKAAG